MSIPIQAISAMLQQSQEYAQPILDHQAAADLLTKEFDINRFAVGFATSFDEIRAAQCLRYQVFTEEMGAQLSTQIPGVDEDMFDAWCEHLIIRDRETDEVIGTYRILTPARAAQLGCYYSESEFLINRFDGIRSELVELGRSCVHSAYRGGGVIMLLWSALAKYMQQHEYEYLIGCVSVSMRDGGHQAASLHRTLATRHRAAAEYQVFPKHPVPFKNLDSNITIEPPALIKGYLRLGAKICGDPAWDPDFNTADFLMLFRMSNMNLRYAKHFGLI